MSLEKPREEYGEGNVPLGTLLDSTFNYFSSETDGENRAYIIEWNRVVGADGLMQYFEKRLRIYDSTKKDNKYSGEEVEIEGDKVSVIAADGPGGWHFEMSIRNNKIRASLKAVKNERGEYDYGLFAPKIEVNLSNDTTYSVVFGQRIINSITRDRYLNRPDGSYTHDTRTFVFSDALLPSLKLFEQK